MSPMIRRSIIGALALTVVIGLLAFSLLTPHTGTTPTPDTPNAAPIAHRADCPTTNLGLEHPLPCLDGADKPGEPKPTIVTLWAWWCAPCREELPLFDELAAAHPEWAVVGAHTDNDGAAGADLATSLGISIPSYQDDRGLLARTYQLPAVIPITVFFHPDGTLAGTHLGPYTSLKDLERDAKDYLQ